MYDLPADESDKFRSGDTALMLSGFHFLRQVQFGENSIALKSDAAEQRLGKVRKMAEQIERAARERRAAERDVMYSGSGDR